MRTTIELPILLAMAMMPASAFAQNNAESVTTYGYTSKSADYYLEPAEYAVHYKRTQLVLNEQTGEQEYQTDTLSLIVGRRWSVFYNMSYQGRFSAWGRQNLKKTRQATKPVNLQSVVPLSSVIEKKNASSDYVEGAFGEPTVIYTDRMEKKTYSALYSPTNVMNEQDTGTSFDWKLLDVQDTVLSYPCRQADVRYSGRDYTAWFTYEIPIPDGPWKFYGLPGLILKVEDAEGYFKYEAVGIEVIESEAYISMNDNIERATMAYFNELADNSRSIRKGTFLFDGELFLTESKPFLYYEMELTDE